VAFKIQKSQFFDLLQKAYPVAPVKSSLQILSNIKLSSHDGVLEVTATDLDHSIRAVGAIEGDEPFEIAVNARKSFDIVREMPNAFIGARIDENVLALKSEQGFSCKIAGADVRDFPEFPEVNEGAEFEIAVSDFSRMVNRSIFAVSKDTSRSCLCGVYWEVSGDKTSMVATDGHRLGSCTIHKNYQIDSKVTAIISPKTLQHVARILDEGEGGEAMVKVKIGEKYVHFSTSTLTVCSKLIEGPYPDYEKVIPKENPKRAIMDKGFLLEAVRRVSVLSNQKTHLVKFNFSGDSLEIVVLNRDIGGEAREVLPIQYDGEEHTMGLNASYLSEMLNIIDAKTIRLEMNTQISACLIYPVYEKPEDARSSDLFLIMPLRIMDEL
jgi:DNA polymerase-3 subunit beta